MSFETVIDIIPFGKLEAADRTIAWPADADVVTNVAAFSDVFTSLLVVEVEEGLLIPVPSLAGLVVLKLFAWLDRQDGKDVQDIRRLLETYTDAGNVDRLYEEEAEELELASAANLQTAIQYQLHAVSSRSPSFQPGSGIPSGYSSRHLPSRERRAWSLSRSRTPIWARLRRRNDHF